MRPNECFIGRICGDTNDEAFARARQICSLPKMVEWMKDYHKKERWINQGDRDFVKSILREIGEIE